MRARQGWSLIETLVAISLFSLILLVVTGSLTSTSRLTRAQVQRSVRQSLLQSSMARMEKLLQRSAVAGIAWLRTPSQGAVLAAHCLQQGCVTTALPTYEPHWQCLIWDEAGHSLFLAESQAAGGFAAPAATHLQAMPAAQLQALLTQETPLTQVLVRGRRLADRVVGFNYTLETGPLFLLELEMDVPPFDRNPATAKERLKASLRVHPRNRI